MATQNALAASLVEEGVALLDGVGGEPPLLTTVCGDVCQVCVSDDDEALASLGAASADLVQWQCGYTGERVGEAAHPGPSAWET